MLVVLDRVRRVRKPGLFALYVAGSSFARIGEELLRVDPAHHILGLRLNFFVAAILTVTGAAWFLHIQRKDDRGTPTAILDTEVVPAAKMFVSVANSGGGECRIFTGRRPPAARKPPRGGGSH